MQVDNLIDIIRACDPAHVSDVYCKIEKILKDKCYIKYLEEIESNIESGDCDEDCYFEHDSCVTHRPYESYLDDLIHKHLRDKLDSEACFSVSSLVIKGVRHVDVSFSSEEMPEQDISFEFPELKCNLEIADEIYIKLKESFNVDRKLIKKIRDKIKELSFEELVEMNKTFKLVKK
jgi:uncharacterized protein YjaG (DUF416 family)